MKTNFNRKKILLCGDFMLDVYLMGEVERISPEAPVPVVCVREEQKKLGGAGNAILNLISLGMDVIAFGRVGEDKEGDYFVEALQKEGVDTRGILRDVNFQTPVKKRVIASGQQIVRLDYEDTTPLAADLEVTMISKFFALLEGVDVVAISDYAKGFLTTKLLKGIIEHAKRNMIPVIVDPKGIDFARYQGATVLKPNLLEASHAAHMGPGDKLDEISKKIFKDLGIENLLITRSKEGISLFDRHQKRLDFQAHVHEVNDVTGAGDTALAVITAALANKIELSHAAELANVAAGIAIERLGCARISQSDLTERLTSA